MGFFDRLFNMVSGFFNSLIGSVEQQNPEIVYERSIQESKKKLKDLKEAVSGIYHLRNKTRAELEEKEALLVDINDQLEVALDEGDDEIALTLSDEQISLEGSVESLRQDLANYENQCESAMDALNSHTNHIRKLQKEKHEMLAKVKSAEARMKIQESLDGLSLDADSQALDNVRESIEKKVAQADIGSELHENSIENRLAKIKAKSGNVKARRRLEELKARRAAAKGGTSSGGDSGPKRNI